MYRLWIIGFFILTAVSRPAPSQAEDIFEAAAEGDLYQITWLLAGDPDLVNAKDEDGRTPLHWACMQDQNKIIGHLVSEGADVNHADHSGLNPLDIAASRGNTPAVDLLLNKKSEINHGAETGWTPLNYAVRNGHADVVGLLISKGANPELRMEDGMRSLHLAVRGGERTEAVLEVLIRSGVELNTKTTNGTTALHMACISSEKAVELLVRGGADPNIAKIYHVTPLHLEAAKGSAKGADILLAYGADINAVCFNGKTALDFAGDYGHSEVAELLRNRGADPDAGSFPVMNEKYPGQRRPGMIPEIFAPGIFITPFDVHGPLAFSPGGKEIFWSQNAQPIPSLWSIKLEQNQWTPPAIASFSSDSKEVIDSAPCFSPDGQRLYFRSNRSAAENAEDQKSHIWFVDRTPDGWSGAQLLDAPFNNSDWSIGGLSMSANGTLYFMAEKDLESRNSEIYRARWTDGRFAEAENLGPAVNSETYDLTPAIAPDESYLVFASIRPGGFGHAPELYISFRADDGGWTEAVHLDGAINQNGAWQPFISSDGQTFFFVNGRTGTGEYWWADARILEKYRAGK
ncbi:MAG: ankyrin repeat domain-containing protein [Candidatus Eisenbacteria bacterium]|nr:ankyrin repeat domain-containing protein [Candidatus Eisenbacteria bacterium]